MTVMKTNSLIPARQEVTDMENARTVICTKCGAQLEPDQDYNIYRCNFCGVAFGSSILFNKDAMEKAD